MKTFTRVCGTAVPLMIPNINTDALAPSRWMRDNPDNPGPGLLWNWRHDAAGNLLPDVPLNRPRDKDARILIAGPNFGCGSSRETAVWTVLGFGIRCVIAPSFSDIYPDNAVQNGLLCVALPEDTIASLAASLDAMDAPELCVDLRSRTIERDGRVVTTFDIAEDRRTALMEGLDQTMVLRRMEPGIAAFRKDDRSRRPWVYEVAED